MCFISIDIDKVRSAKVKKAKDNLFGFLVLIYWVFALSLLLM